MIDGSADWTPVGTALVRIPAAPTGAANQPEVPL
jgi:hypothetical protein